MKKIFTSLLIAASLSAGAQTGAYNEQARAYIRQYKAWAIEEQQRTGVPAAITLAQGIHETQAGTSELATEANNHFGIKCKKNWTGETYAHTDDAPNECFRKYAKAYDSYKDHSDYLRQTPRYVHCFEQDVTDYAGWARELKAAGYATNPRYAQKLVNIVEDFHLQDYTYEAMKAPQPQGEGLQTAPVAATEAPQQAERRTAVTERREESRQQDAVAATETVAEEAPAPAPTPVYGQLTTRHNLRGFYGHKGDVLLEQAIKYNMRYAKILELNDLPDAPLEADMFVYTEKKRGIGVRNRHTVQQGETMLQIAQAEGMQLKQLRALNNMLEGEEPAVDAVLNLQTAAAGKPALRNHREQSVATTYRPAAAPRDADLIAAGRPMAQIDEAEEEEKPVESKPQPAARVTPVGQPRVADRPAEKIPEEPMAMPVSSPVTTPAPKPAPRPVTAPAPPRQKTYTIADELAVGEEAPKYSPRYQPQANVQATAPQTPDPAPVAAEEPQDDFSRLKSRLDKAVYAQKTNTPAPAPVRTAAPEVTQREPASAPEAATEGPAAYHVVKAGETAFGIAKQNNITVKQLRDLNNLNFEAIKVGQKLRVR